MARGCFCYGINAPFGIKSGGLRCQGLGLLKGAEHGLMREALVPGHFMGLDGLDLSQSSLTSVRGGQLWVFKGGQSLPQVSWD
ncbi:hypothetical protein GBA52_024652 [Prunus armeniaca]|nr:hypothetical protein GBA52_024652 [Prunus armeniaca]